MADSNVTKRALAAALKEIIKEVPFEKINVAQICDRCSMNRKSFYYHFRDKYDLVNWIFDTEFIATIGKQSYNDRWDFLEYLFRYFYENRSFYRKVLRIKGQNSFSEHFRAYLCPVLCKRLEALVEGQKVEDFYVDFLADAFICALARWLINGNGMEPDKFVAMSKALIQSSAVAICEEMKEVCLE